MKIALGLEYPLALRGGVSVLVEELIRGISPKHEVVLVSPDGSGFEHPGLEAHLHWNPHDTSRGAAKALAARLADLGVHLAHFHFGGNYGWGSRIPGQSPFGFLRNRGIASVTTIHVIRSVIDDYCGPEKPLWFKLLLLPGAWLGKLDVLRNVKAEIIISQQGWRKARRWYWPYRNRFEVIYHSRIDETERLAAVKREPLILAVGHVAFRKGQHTLVEAFSRIDHPEWKLFLIGPASSDGCSTRIEQIIAERGLADRISLLGSRNDAMDFMRRAGVFVQPSLFEGLPLALQEAMYCGCACVATDVVGNNELIENGKTGLLVPPENPDAMAKALDQLIRQSHTRDTLGQSAAASIINKGMTRQKMISHHLKLYERYDQDGKR